MTAEPWPTRPEGWRLAWDVNPPTEDDPEWDAYIALGPVMDAYLEALKDATPEVRKAAFTAYSNGRETVTPPDGKPGGGESLERMRRLGDEPSRIALAAYLERVRGYLLRYVSFPSEHEPAAIALWVAHAHLIEHFEVSPILAATSPEKRSGKTRILDCLEMLCPRPWRVALPSEAVLYSMLAKRPPPTLLFDEVDTVFTTRTSERQEGIRAILNAGNQRGTPVARVRMDGRRREVEEFDVFGAKALAGIGELPDTVADRSILLRMRRKSVDEPVARFRRRQAREEAGAIAAPDWPSVPLVSLVPHIGAPMNDRAEDSWEPLLIIAATAGGPWPARARAAAVNLSGDGDDTETVSLGIRLLADIRDVFQDRDTPQYMSTTGMLAALHDMEDAPWGSLRGDPLSARYLARLLRPYGIKPDHWREGEATIRGYLRDAFDDAWRRYCPSVGAPVRDTSGTTGTDDESPVEDDYPSSAWATA